MVTQELARLKPEARRRAWPLFCIVVGILRHAPERAATLERVAEALAVDTQQDGRRDRHATR